MRTNDLTVQRIRVPAGFLFGLVFLIYSRPLLYSLVAGLLVAVVGIGLRIWAAGHLEKWKRLAVGGPYQFTRNPLYLGSFLIGVGFTLASSRLGLCVCFLLLFILVYRPVMKLEEKELRKLYGADYQRYKERVPLFSPGRPFPTSEGPGNSSFAWKRVWKNREYNSILGYLGLSLFLYWRLICFI